jgi:hypothetical protein
MDKLILVFEIGVGYLDSEEVQNYLDYCIKTLKIEDESIIQFFIPTNERVNRIECLNPKLMKETEYIDVQKKLEEIKLKNEKFLNAYNNELI